MTDFLSGARAGGHRMLCAGVRADVLEDFTRLQHFRPTSLRPKNAIYYPRLHWRDRGLPSAALRKRFIDAARSSPCLTTLAIA